jgi:hypothetical protein
MEGLEDVPIRYPNKTLPGVIAKDALANAILNPRSVSENLSRNLLAFTHLRTWIRLYVQDRT